MRRTQQRGVCHPEGNHVATLGSSSECRVVVHTQVAPEPHNGDGRDAHVPSLTRPVPRLHAVRGVDNPQQDRGTPRWRGSRSSIDFSVQRRTLTTEMIAGREPAGVMPSPRADSGERPQVGLRSRGGDVQHPHGTRSGIGSLGVRPVCNDPRK